MQKIDIIIFGVGQIGQQISKELCELKQHGWLELNKLYLCGRDLKKMDAIREDLLSSLLLSNKRKGIKTSKYLLVEDMLVACDLTQAIEADVAILSFGVPIQTISEEVLHESQRDRLFNEHSSILDSLLPLIKGKNGEYPWLINIVNPVEKICQYIAQKALCEPEKIVGCSAELDAARGLKYYLRDGADLDEFCQSFYIGQHDEQGKYLMHNSKSGQNIDLENTLAKYANKEGGYILYHKGTAPVFGPSESAISLIVALCGRTAPTVMSCSVWSAEQYDFYSSPVNVSHFKIESLALQALNF